MRRDIFTEILVYSVVSLNSLDFQRKRNYSLKFLNISHLDLFVWPSKGP